MQRRDRLRPDHAVTLPASDPLPNFVDNALAEPEPAQLPLWTDPEREQLERNKSSLRARLETIPAEIEREAEAIRARCADPTPRLFPIAVTYLVPEKLAREAGGRR
jgi:hypothetical protein